MPVSRVHFKHHRQEGSSQVPRVGPIQNCGTLLASHTNQHQFLCAGVVRAPGIHGWRFANTARNLFPQSLPSPTQCLFLTDTLQLLPSLSDCLIRLQCKPEFEVADTLSSTNKSSPFTSRLPTLSRCRQPSRLEMVTMTPRRKPQLPKKRTDTTPPLTNPMESSVE